MTTETKTLKGTTRRYRIFVAANGGKQHRGYEFTQWVKKHWQMFAASLGLPDDPVNATPVHLTHLFRVENDRTGNKGLAKTQEAFDDFIEAKYGIAKETDPHVWI